MYTKLCLVSLFIVASYGMFVRPIYPEMFTSNWTYTLTGPQDIISKGWTLWAGYDKSLYYYMSALEGWEQLLTGTKIYNFYREIQSCCIDDYGWPLFDDYFNNATFIGFTQHENSTKLQWIGSLYTQPVFGYNVTYVVSTEPQTGYPTSYISANVVNYNESEIMYRFDINYTQPPLEWFKIPNFCLNAPACVH